MDLIVCTILFAVMIASVFALGYSCGRKSNDNKVYQHVKMLDKNMFDEEDPNLRVANFEAEDYHYCPDACYENIIVFVKDEEDNSKQEIHLH